MTEKNHTEDKERKLLVELAEHILGENPTNTEKIRLLVGQVREDVESDELKRNPPPEPKPDDGPPQGPPPIPPGGPR